MFPVVHKKLWLWVLRSLHWEIFSQKGIQNTTKCLWWFWSSNTRLQAHYRHCQPLSHVVWQHYWNSGIYTTFDSIIPTYTDIYLLIQIIPTYTCNTYRYGTVSRPLIIMPYNNVITKGIIQNLWLQGDMQYLQILSYTYKYRQYLLISVNTQIYLSIPWDTCLYMSIPTILILKQPYLCNQWSVWHEPKNSINNRQLQTNGSGLWYILPVCYHMTAYWKLSKKAFFGAPEQW